MRVHVVSDVHGNAEGLAKAGDGADALICLGDLVLFLDYADHSRGIFPDLFGVENADRIVALRTARRFEEARELGRSLWAGLDRRGRDRGRGAPPVRRAVRRLPHPDVRHLRQRRHAGPLAAVRGTRHHRARRPARRDRRPRLRLRRRRPAHPDAHALSRSPTRSTPPRSRRSARSTCSARTSRPRSPSSCTTPSPAASSAASRALLAAIHRTRPRYSLFGHVHQPLARRMRIGRTECVNVGHFAATSRPFALEW